MARINDPSRVNISTIADGDLLPIVDVSDATLDKNITMAQIKAFSAPDISGKQNLITTPVNNDVVLTDVNGQTKDSGVQLSAFTQQGNTFNGNSQLVKLTSAGKYPALNGSLITNIIPADTIVDLGTVSTGTTTLTADKFHKVTFSGAATIALPGSLTTGVHYNCSLLVTMSSIVTITQPTVTWAYGTTPALTSTSVKYRITYETIDAGTTWYGYWTQLGA